VSVVMPTFNRLQFLPAAVRSITVQTFTDWELIIADDGSDAETRAYLKTLEDPPRVRVLWLPHSGKPTIATNAALREAHGEYVAFLDSDDVWLPRKLETQMTSLERHPGRRWSHTRFGFIDGAGEPHPAYRERSWPALSGWILEKLLKEETLIAQPSVIVSRQLLNELGAFDEQLVMCYDQDLWIRLASESEIDAVDEVLTLVRRHSEHGGDDVIAWRDRGRVFAHALARTRDAHIRSILRRLRVEMASGLAASQATSGMRAAVLRTLVSSAHYSWRYPQWWQGSIHAVARAFAPLAARKVVHRYRRARRLPSQPQA